jgi:hypothetical protein
MECQGSKARIDVVEHSDAREQVSNVADFTLLECITRLQQHAFGDFSARVSPAWLILKESVITEVRTTLK